MNFIICHVELDGGDRYSVGWADSKARFKIEQRQRRIGTERGKVATAGALVGREREADGFSLLHFVLYGDFSLIHFVWGFLSLRGREKK